MAKVFTPLIGLAVVVALAMAAVFGAMSLNPTPALAQDTTATVHVKETVNVDITSLIPGGGANYESATKPVVTPAGAATAADVVTGFDTIEVPVTGVAPGAARITLRVTTKDDQKKSLKIDVVVVAATPATAVGAVLDQKVKVKFEQKDGKSVSVMGDTIEIEMADYFKDGSGTAGKITKYAATSSDEGKVVPNINDSTGVLELHAPQNAEVGGSAFVTVTAEDSFTDKDADGKDIHPKQTFYVDVVAAGAVGTTDTTVKPSSVKPGSNTRYVVKFTAVKRYTPGVDDITVELVDFQVPGSIDTEDVTIQSVLGESTLSVLGESALVASPADITVDGEEITLVLGDMDTESDGVQYIPDKAQVTVIFRTDAGIKNPTEGGGYDEIEVNGEVAAEVTIIRTISLSEDDGGRGDIITATGKGFKNGTTLTFWRDQNVDGDIEGESDLCSVVITGNDIGSCEFEITVPLFASGLNHINAGDGRSNTADLGELGEFELKPSIEVTPNSGSPGETLQVQLYDFPENKTVIAVLLARRSIMVEDSSGVEVPWTPSGSTRGAAGELNFRLVVPDNAPEGLQDLQVKVDGGKSANTNVTIGGPVVTATPNSVVANQRVSLVGSGFHAGSEIDTIEIGGVEIASSRINGSDTVNVDNGGNWSAAVDLPLDNRTTTEGSRTIRVTDLEGRSGSLDITIPAREVTITPERGRVGTTAVVRGMNFPSKNDDGDSFSVEIVYEASSGKTTVTAVPDASGRFETEIRIPTTANIPSTNVVKVQFEAGSSDTPVVTTVTHDVPEGVISLSTQTGSPGSAVTVSGEGFKAFVPVTSVKVGALEVTPSPRPSTDGQGMVNFDITIPGLDNGIQTIEVEVGNTIASQGFTVTPSGIAAGNVTEAAAAVENLGESFVRSFNFNNDTKTWTFYDPAAGDASTQANFIAGESYWILVTETTEAILKGTTRNLTCVGGNCWNQIVW